MSMSARWRTCIGPECEVRVPAHVVACRTHWWRLPLALRTTIAAAQRAGDVRTISSARREAARFLLEEAMPQATTDR